MPRPTKCRKVCRLPGTLSFVPGESGEDAGGVVLTVDEYETIRLIDREGFSQEECGEYMQVARTTVQQIYTCARKKIAKAIVDGLPIRIQGGNYQICEGGRNYYGCGGCKKRRFKNMEQGGETNESDFTGR